MPVCFKNAQLVNLGGNQFGNGRVLVGSGANSTVPASPQVQPLVPTLADSAFGIESCDFVGLTAAEFEKVMSSSSVAPNAWQELGNMTIQDAQVISAYIAVVWAVAWGFRVLRSAVVNYYESSQNE